MQPPPGVVLGAGATSGGAPSATARGSPLAMRGMSSASGAVRASRTALLTALRYTC